MDLVALCTLMGLSITVFIVPLLWFRALDNRRASQILAVFVLVVGVSLLQTLLLHSGLTLRHPWVSGLGQFFYFALGPLLYCYTKTLADRTFGLTPREAWHFLPVVISLLVYLPVYLQSSEIKRHAVEVYFALKSVGGVPQLAALPLSTKIYITQFVALMLHLATYSVLTLRQLEKHRTRIELVFSNLERINLSWMRWLTWLVLAVSVMSLLYISIRLSFPSPVSPDLRVVPVLIMVVLVYYAGWMGIRQPQIYGTELESDDPSDEETAAPDKYHSTGLSATDAKEHWHRVQQFVEKEQPYLRSGLIIKQLADELSMSTAHLSQVINSYAQVTFFDYINCQRIEYSQQQLADPGAGKRKVLDIAYSSGFSSQSTFYAQFKKHTGCTPSQYRYRLNDPL